MMWFWITCSAIQLAAIIYLIRRLVLINRRHAAAVRMAEDALDQANIALKAVEHLQRLNAQIRRHRNSLVLNGELFRPYTIGNNNPPTIWRIYPKH